jgi:hypothetical protein
MIVTAGLALGGCAGGGTGADLWPKSEPTRVSVQFQSDPAGAEAKTSTGEACKTPCSLAVASDKDFSVTFSLTGYEPQTVPVEVSKPDGTGATLEPSLEPNPVAVELAKSSKRPPAKKRTATASAAKPAAARPAAARPAAARSAPRAPAPAPAPAAPAPATDPWPPVSPQ